MHTHARGVGSHHKMLSEHQPSRRQHNPPRAGLRLGGPPTPSARPPPRLTLSALLCDLVDLVDVHDAMLSSIDIEIGGLGGGVRGARKGSGG